MKKSVIANNNRCEGETEDKIVWPKAFKYWSMSFHKYLGKTIGRI